MKRKFHKLFHSTVSQFFLCLVCFVVPILLISMYNMQSSRNQAISALVNAYQSVLQKNMAELETQLFQINYYTMDLAFNRTEPRILSHSSVSPEGIHAQYALSQEFDDELPRYGCLGTLFIYLPDQDFYLCRSADGDQSELSSAIQEHIQDEIHQSASLIRSYPWRLLNLDGHYYLFQMILNENIVTGSYIDTVLLMETLELPNLDYGSLIFQPGETHSQEIFMDQDLVKVSVPSSYDFTLSYEFPADKVGAHLSFVNRYSVLLCLVLILAFILFLVLIHRIVIRPITHLNESMLRLGEGDLDYRIEKVADTSEFQLLYQTFNKMVNEIQNLKIKVYEEQLTAQRFKLNILQLQVKPHFIINTLNMVYNLLYAQQTETAESLLLCTIKYFRFMMKITDNVIPVSDEIEHIDAYVQIQKLRYMKDFQFVKEIHSLTREAMIPPLLIHQFVENAIKYAMSADHPLLICLETQYLEIDYDPYIKILIRDNGPGYSQELLAALNEGQDIRAADGNHFGIISYLEQLQYLYRDFRWHFSNEGGACVELVLPICIQEEEALL